MSTQHATKADDPAHPKARRAFDDAHIRMRGEGRQLVIDAGEEPEADDHDIHPDRENEAPATEATPPTPQGKDQHITGYSDGQRRRMRKRMHAMDRSADGLFITLTYHKTDPDPDEVKTHLDLFWKRLRRRFSGISAIWKMEPQERGIPHFHLMLYGQAFIPAQLLSSIWHDVTDETSHKHRKSGVDVQGRSVNEDGKLQAYMGKYMAKTYDGWPGAEEGDPWAEPGRWWGCLGRENLPWAEWDEAKIHLDQHEAKALIRQLLDEWGVDLPDGVVPPSLCICTRGDPHDWIEKNLPV